MLTTKSFVMHKMISMCVVLKLFINDNLKLWFQCVVANDPWSILRHRSSVLCFVFWFSKCHKHMLKSWKTMFWRPAAMWIVFLTIIFCDLPIELNYIYTYIYALIHIYIERERYIARPSLARIPMHIAVIRICICICMCI